MKIVVSDINSDQYTIIGLRASAQFYIYCSYTTRDTVSRPREVQIMLEGQTLVIQRSILTIIFSVLYYCYPAYGSSLSREDTGRILKLQNTAARIIYSSHAWTKCPFI
ncbi:hypothetical protein J6590_092811, partial [Homalodisca vitripennis]